MKKLIINADDFGLAKCVNHGIVHSFINGVLTSASIMANGHAFDEAVLLSKQYPSLSVGIHLVLVEEKPVLPANEIPSLIEKKSERLYQNYGSFIRAFFWGKIQLLDIEKELKAQIERVFNANITPSHINSHQHLHMLPPILNIVLKLAKKYNIQWIRNTYDMLTYQNSIAHKVLKLLGYIGKKAILKKQLRTTDSFLGTKFSGNISENALLDILNNHPPGTSELMCHPGNEDEALHRSYGHWHYHWGQEKDALTLQNVKEIISQKGIVLTNYHDLSK
jgi:hopanoid biosynthesis associated protein HpnK